MKKLIINNSKTSNF